MISDQEIVVDTGWSKRTLTKDELRKEDLIYAINDLKDALQLQEEKIIHYINAQYEKNIKIMDVHNYEFQEYLNIQLKWIRKLQKRF
jgi:hypothetical protein